MPKAKAEAKAKATAKAVRAAAKPKLDRYAYLPTDLQRAAVFMDRGDFLRKLQIGQHDREHRHVATQGPPPISVDKDLQEKIAALNAGIESLRERPPQPLRKTYARSKLRADDALYRRTRFASDVRRLVRFYDAICRTNG